MKSSKLTKLFACIMSILVLFLGLGLILKFTGLSDKIRDELDTDFRVVFEDNIYKVNENPSNILLPTSGEAFFSVKGTKSFKLSVKPYLADYDSVEFSVDGSDVVFNYGSEDLSNLVVKNDDIFEHGFKIDCSESLKLQDLLSREFGADVTVSKILNYPYLITITNSDGDKIELAVGMRVPVESVDLDFTDVIF